MGKEGQGGVGTMIITIRLDVSSTTELGDLKEYLEDLFYDEVILLGLEEAGITLNSLDVKV